MDIDRPFLDYLALLAEVGDLAGVDLAVPADPEPNIVRELLNARRLLRGESIRGRWKDGQVAFDGAEAESIAAVVEVGARHRFAVDADAAVTINGVHIPLGLVRREFDDAVVDEVEHVGSQIVLQLRATGGSADMVMTPLDPHRVDPDLGGTVELQSSAFDDLVVDLDAPLRPSAVRHLI
jgi:hypothetical protein